MTVFSERLKELRKEKGLTADKAAEEIGIQRSTLSNYENGTRYPRRKAMDAILDFYNVDQAYLEGRTDIKNRYGFQGIYNRGYNQGLKDAHSNSASPNHDASNVTFLESPGPVVPIKVYGSVPAGVPVEAIEDVVDEIYIPKSWIKSGQKFIGLRVKGSSMYPKYLDGDTVVIQLQEDCQSGQDCVVYVNGYEATLKTLYKEADGRIRLQPINPEYEPRYYGPNDDPVKLLGVVKQLIRSI